MTVYVDPPLEHGNKTWCHMTTDQADLTELHQIAVKLGIRRYFQKGKSHPHYDILITKRGKVNKRDQAIAAGATDVDHDEYIAAKNRRLELARQSPDQHAGEYHPGLLKPKDKPNAPPTPNDNCPRPQQDGDV